MHDMEDAMMRVIAGRRHTSGPKLAVLSIQAARSHRCCKPRVSEEVGDRNCNTQTGNRSDQAAAQCVARSWVLR